LFEKISKVKIVITTIFPPSPAVKKFSGLSGYDLIVVGDKKTPPDWEVQNSDFVKWDDHRFKGFPLADLIPFNHYARKNIGYVLAMRQGAQAIIDTDDDNFPLDGFGFPPLVFSGETSGPGLGFVNVYKQFTSQKIWPRGLPVREILSKENDFRSHIATSDIGVWQGLANGDPDVDAIYRLTDNSDCIFVERDPLVLDDGTWSPFNSQNTLFRRELFPLLYLPVTVSFRFTDILRSFVAQPIMWAGGYRLGFTSPTVFQDRNPHNHLADLVSEFPMYENSEKLPELLEGAFSPSDSLLSALIKSYAVLEKNRVVTVDELACLDAWVEECSSHGFY